MMSMNFKGCGENALTVDAVVENLDEVTAFVDGIMEKSGFSLKAQMQIDIAVEEVFVNIANYAYGDGTGKAEITADFRDGELTLVFKDSGVPFNPLEKEDPDITLSADEREIGGLGIFIVKKNLDEVFYNYENSQNVLTLKKRLQQ